MGDTKHTGGGASQTDDDGCSPLSLCAVLCVVCVRCVCCVLTIPVLNLLYRFECEMDGRALLLCLQESCVRDGGFHLVEKRHHLAFVVRRMKGNTGREGGGGTRQDDRTERGAVAAQGGTQRLHSGSRGRHDRGTVGRRTQQGQTRDQKDEAITSSRRTTRGAHTPAEGEGAARDAAAKDDLETCRFVRWQHVRSMTTM